MIFNLVLHYHLHCVNSPDVYNYLFFCLVSLALVLFIRKITMYQDFIGNIKTRNTEAAEIKVLNLLSDCEEKPNIKTRVELYYNPLIVSPMMTGFLHPAIVLPVRELEEKELSYIFAHELIHYKQKDMFYKWLIQIVICVHWFNPFVYLLEKEVNKSCELSCDEKVISALGDQARHEYGDTLISFLKSNHSTGINSAETSKSLIFIFGSHRDRLEQSYLATTSPANQRLRSRLRRRAISALQIETYRG